MNAVAALLLAAIGAVVSAVAVAWALKWIGPRSQNSKSVDSAIQIAPVRVDVGKIEEQYIDEIMARGRELFPGTEGMTAVLKAMFLDSSVQVWLVENGDPSKRYEYDSKWKPDLIRGDCTTPI